MHAHQNTTTMKKTTKTVFECEYCGKAFKNPNEALKHEDFCKRKHLDSEKMEGYLLAIAHHFEKLGYKVTFRYLFGELLFELKKNDNLK